VQLCDDIHNRDEFGAHVNAVVKVKG